MDTFKKTIIKIGKQIMNDFTKEKLKTLFLKLNIAIRNWEDAPEYKHYPKLKDKGYREQWKRMKLKMIE